MLVVLGVLVLVGFVAYAVVNATGKTQSLGTNSSLALVTYAPAKQVAPPRTELQRLGGGAPVAVGGDMGRPSVVNFFASWCPACRKELASDAAVAKTGVVRFVGVDTDDTDPGEALTLLRNAHATYPVGIGHAGLAESYGTGNLPTTAFLDRSGHIVAIALGAIPRRQLATWVGELARGVQLTSVAPS